MEATKLRICRNVSVSQSTGKRERETVKHSPNYSNDLPHVFRDWLNAINFFPTTFEPRRIFTGFEAVIDRNENDETTSLAGEPVKGSNRFHGAITSSASILVGVERRMHDLCKPIGEKKNARQANEVMWKANTHVLMAERGKNAHGTAPINGKIPNTILTCYIGDKYCAQTFRRANATKHKQTLGYCCHCRAAFAIIVTAMQLEWKWNWNCVNASGWNCRESRVEAGAEGGMDDAIEWIIHRQRKTEALHFYWVFISCQSKQRNAARHVKHGMQREMETVFIGENKRDREAETERGKASKHQQLPSETNPIDMAGYAN